MPLIQKCSVVFKVSVFVVSVAVPYTPRISKPAYPPVSVYMLVDICISMATFQFKEGHVDHM